MSQRGYRLGNFLEQMIRIVSEYNVAALRETEFISLYTVSRIIAWMRFLFWTFLYCLKY